MQFDWTIAQLERQTETGGVITAHWRVSSEDEAFTAGSYGSAGFTPDPESENFIPFEELTEEVVIDWVKDALGSERIDQYIVTIEQRFGPETLVETPLPWVPTEPEVTEPEEEPIETE